MAETDREEVVSMLRACLLSSKYGIPLSNLNRDYELLAGTKIPYQALGYESLEQFLNSLPDITVKLGRGGEKILNAIPNKNTEHIATLISKQKSPSRKSKSTRKYVSSRHAAASLRRPPPSPVKTSRHTPTADSRMPLSITVNNQLDSEKYHFAEPFRLVSFASAPSKPLPPSAQPAPSSSGGEHSRHTFERPPRFLRMSREGSIASKESAPELVASVTCPVTTSSNAQERLRQAVSTAGKVVKSNNFRLNLNGTEAVTSKAANNAHKAASRGGPTITSPLTPLQARLNGSTWKHTQVQETLSLEEQLTAVSLGGTENFVRKLEEYAVSKGMSTPTFKILPRKSYGQQYYYSVVKVDDFSVNSYPDERSSPLEAMNIAAKRALEEIDVRSKGIGGNVTENKNVIMSRISNIVSGHCGGIWSTHIPVSYYQLYNETLPIDWLKIMEKCPLVNLEQAVGNRTIITPKHPASPAQCASPIIEVAAFSMEASHGSSSLSSAEPVVPEPITLPDHDEWDMFITCGNSTDEIWGRLIGEEYSVKYENLATDMEMFYMGQVNIAVNPKIGSYYAIKMDDCWHRVELVEMDETHSRGQVFFIDHGDEEHVDLNQLHLLEQHFARLPAQAIRCFLWGLEHFADDQNATRHITDTIVGKVLIASVMSRPNEKNPEAGIVLFDTSTEEDLNLNTVLIESISKDAVAPQLPAEGKVQEVYISHVSSSGDVFLQFKSYSYLQSLLSDVTENCLKGDIVKGSSAYIPDPSRLYLARYHQDDNWYRAAITKKLGQTEVEVIFVDFGNTEIVNTSELILLETLKKSVAQFPHQAIKVHLHNVPYSSFDERMALRVRELVPFDECVLVKTISARSPSIIPVVEIFKRIQPDNLLVSVNGTLAFEPDLKPAPKPAAKDSNTLRGKKRLERLQSQGLAVSNICPSDALGSGNSTGALQHVTPIGFNSYDDETASNRLGPPQIPLVNEYFDVMVSLAANPGNFTVQPYKDADQLLEMMRDMQTQYNQQRYPHPSVDSIKEGRLYAALHDDRLWYRVCVSNVINDNMVSVHFCDYGDVAFMSLERLQPLTDQFKELPYQAIKAKLAGIRPKHSDWSVEDCLMFQELVVRKEFVSIVMEKGPDILNPTSMTVGLRLIDTSQKEDVWIDELLVNQERAVKIT